VKVLAILGAGGHGKVVADTAESNGWDSIVFFDDAWPALQKNGIWSVVGTSNDLIRTVRTFSGVVVAIGNNAIRRAKLTELAAIGASIVTLVHPSAIISRYASLGLGSVAFPGVVVNAEAVVGEGAILNTGCSVDHDCRVGAAVHLSPGVRLAGGVEVGDCSWIGIGATARQLVKIGNNVVVGASAAVVSDLPDNTVAVGVPARIVVRQVR